MHKDDLSLLRTAGLGGREALVVDAAGAGTALLVEVNATEMIDVWRTARAAVERTHRWPVLCCNWTANGSWSECFAHEDLFSRFYFNEGSPDGDGSPTAVLARAARIDVDARVADLARRRCGEVVADIVDFERRCTLEHFGAAPSPQQVHTAITGAEAPWVAVERYLFDWERARVPAREPDLCYQDWYDASSHQLALVLGCPR